MKHLSKAYNELMDRVFEEFKKIDEFILCNDEELMHTDKKYDMPRTFYNYTEYAIVKIDGNRFLAVSIEDSDDRVYLSYNDLSLNTLIDVLTEIEQIKDNE